MQSSRRIRFGIVNESPRPAGGWLEHVRRIERLGFDIFLIRDHLLPDYFGPQLGPLAALAMAAGTTSRIHVGSLVLNNDLRHPAVLAKELATIAELSGGRLEIGLGAGWLEREYRLAGLPYDRPGTRIERLSDSVGILTGLLSGATVTATGKHYRLSGLDTFPVPARPPRLLIGGGRPRLLELAGRVADSIAVLSTSVATGTAVDDPAERSPAATEAKIEAVRRGAGNRFAQIELCLMPTLLLSEDRERTAAELAGARGWAGVDARTVLEMPSMLIGTQSEVEAAMAERTRRYGFTYFVFSDAVLDSVAPLVAQRAAA